MARLQDNDPAALDELIARYWRPLVAFAMDTLDDRDAAHDIAQETFIRLWRRRHLWQPRGSVGAWLFRTARNLAISQHRRRAARARWAATHQATTYTSRTPLDEAEDEEVRAAVKATLQSLSPRRREAFTLFYLRSLSYKDIAEIMGIRQQSVANHLQAALEDMRVALGKFFPVVPAPEAGNDGPAAKGTKGGIDPRLRLE